jgi:hypothetical protein
MTHARILASHLADLLSREHIAMADFLVALADFDRNKGWAGLGHASLFCFLHRELGLSKGAAHYRKVASVLVQKFPEIVEPFRDGRLCITSVVHLAKVLTPENRREMLPKFFQRSRQESMALAAAIQPASAGPHRDVVTGVRSVPGAAGAAFSASQAGSVDDQNGTPAVVQPGEPAVVQPGEPAVVQPGEPAMVQPGEPAGVPSALSPTEPPPLPPRSDSSEPLTGELSRLHITVSRQFLEKLEAARAALSHTHPGATIATIVEAGLDLVLKQHAKRKGLVDKPRKKKQVTGQRQRAGNDSAAQKSAAAPSRSIPAEVMREVWTRDQGRCQWPLESGGICGSTWRVEVDHRVALALGGSSTAANLRVLCRVHNDLAARRAFGDAWMDQFTGNGKRRKSSGS